MRSAKSTITAAVALAFAAVWSPELVAQTGDTQQQAEDFSQQEIKAFALASMEVASISESYAPKLQAADTTDQRRAIRKEASEEMLSAVREKGLTADRYNRIAKAAQEDPALAEKIETIWRSQ